MGEHIITETIKTIVTLDTIELPENPTNGDMIKAMFPFVTKYITHNEHNIYIDSPIQACVYTFDRNWWNAPYKGVSKCTKVL